MSIKPSAGNRGENFAEFVRLGGSVVTADPQLTRTDRPKKQTHRLLAVADRWRFVPPERKSRRPCRRGGQRRWSTCTFSSSPISGDTYNWMTPVTGDSYGWAASNWMSPKTDISVMAAVSRCTKVSITADPFSMFLTVGTRLPRSGMHRDYQLVYNRNGMLKPKCSMQKKSAQRKGNEKYCLIKRRTAPCRLLPIRIRMSANRFLMGNFKGICEKLKLNND